MSSVRVVVSAMEVDRNTPRSISDSTLRAQVAAIAFETVDMHRIIDVHRNVCTQVAQETFYARGPNDGQGFGIGH